jgi:hypothetical protein
VRWRNSFNEVKVSLRWQPRVSREQTSSTDGALEAVREGSGTGLKLLPCELRRRGVKEAK